MKLTVKDFQRLKPKKISKYRSEKIVVDGITFDSKKEAARWRELKLLEKAGEISFLRRQPEFVLIETQRDENGVLLEKKCTYRADFDYLDKDLNHVVEDVKGFRTKDYIIKRKLMLKNFGIRIKEV